jgi:TRAP-type C4-dicarboxylate transport system permease large subunit
MNIFERIKYKLSTSIRFVALLSLILQLIILSFIFFGKIEATVFIFIFYLFLIVIGISRYVELTSKNFKEVVFNLFYLINCFPLIFIVLFVSIHVLEQTNMPKEENIDANQIELKVIDKNKEERIKSPNEIDYDIKNKKLEDSIIEVKISE